MSVIRHRPQADEAVFRLEDDPQILVDIVGHQCWQANAEVDQVESVAREIAELDAINAVMITMGEFNILAISVFNDMEGLAEIASDQILALPGVHHIETSVAVRTEQYNTGMAKITAIQNVDNDTAD